ncbi:MAG TPA: sigma-70 family RNA polymerase sigma factor [Terriglobales bacterium]|nr:sigma-70 family RNA polymerase sigma factor [Terriglobales bacterium]
MTARAMMNAVAWPAAATPAEASFEALVRDHQRRIYTLLLGILRDRDAAETLTQECFLRAYQAQDSFRGEAQVGTWLARIAVNLARDHIRNRRLMFWRRVTAQPLAPVDLAEELADARADTDRRLIAEEQVRQVWTVVERLSARQRAIFIMRFVQEMEITEIAAVLELKASTVRVHLMRALETVQKAVAK